MVNETVLHAGGQVLEWKWSTNNPLMERPFWTSAYLIDQTLLDCGAPGSVSEIGQFIDGLPPATRPTRCFLTHAHEDHCGTGKLLIEKYHIPVYAPPQLLPLLKAGRQYPDYRKLAWGDECVAGFEAQPYPPSIETPKGYKFVLLALPGHDPDLHAFIEKKHQWAFVGDLMLPQYQMLFGTTSDIQEDIKTITESLEKLYNFTEGLEKLLIFVSGRGVFQGRAIIKARIAEIHELHEKAHKLYKEFGSDVKESQKMRKMLKTLFGGESFFAGMSYGHLSRENMINSLLKWKT
jgi:glyoxylase-like metal-dependent hydrolase (beta-lactamase superfamily II)